MRRLFLLAASVPGALVTAASACTIETSPAYTITAEEIQTHVDFLASDLLAGRDSGFPGAEVAAAYIAAHLESCGFVPLFADWLMPFALSGARQASGASLIAGDLLERGDARRVAARSFSGSGMVRGRAARPAGDVAGSIVVADGGATTADDEEAALALQAQGAAGVVFVTDLEHLPSPRRDGRRRGAPRGAQDRPAAGGGYLPGAESAAHAITIPVLRVARELGPSLREAADAGGLVQVDVAFEGKDETANVIGMLEGSDPELKNEYVIIGAHYDHVGQDDAGNIWNGADDNASGTAGVLEIADALARMDPRPKRSILVCLWSAEERGLLGSRAFANAAPIDFERVAAYLNLDMVSRNAGKPVSVVHSSDDLFTLVSSAARRHGLEVRSGQDFYLNASDTQAFVRRKVPCVFPFTETHEDYHRPSDDPDTIDADRAMRVTRTALDVMLAVASGAGRPDFTEPVARSDLFSARRVLGFSPDGAPPSGRGITVAEVSPDSTAAAAGLEPGDVIVRVGSSETENLNALRAAITLPAANEEFEIEVLRGDARVVLKARFRE